MKRAIACIVSDSPSKSPHRQHRRGICFFLEKHLRIQKGWSIAIEGRVLPATFLKVLFAFDQIRDRAFGVMSEANSINAIG